MRDQLYYQLNQFKRDLLETKKEAYARAVQKYVNESENVSDERIKEIYTDITNLTEGLLQEEEKAAMIKYENNTVFRDAINKKISVHDTFQELYKVNKGLKKFLPRQTNPAHNKRATELNELVNVGNGLQTRGLIHYDNVFNSGLYIALLNYGGISLLSEKPIDYTAPDFMAAALFGGILQFGISLPAMHLWKRNVYSDIVTEQSQYLDERIRLHYK
ncbi:MAG TPA: hypothetical protein VEC16_00490 [Alphaproteobacteria bacterium]|nr:hypothetical protein [Alphaproteobacteria bacterium]